MAGKFSIGETKVRPGAYHRQENAGGLDEAGAINGIGAGVIRANWGPLNKVVEFEPSTNVKQTYGSGHTEDLITRMFAGGITSGFFVRVGKGGTAPTVTLKAGSADAGTITGAYVGDRAFTVTIRDSITGENRECIIYEGSAEFCKIAFTPGGNEPKALQEAMKEATADFIFTPAEGATSVLDNVTQAAFTPGTNPTVTTEDYSAAFSALEPFTFNVLTLDTTDPAVQLLAAAFIDRIDEAGAYAIACFGSDKADTLEERMTAAAAYNSEKITYVLNGAVDAAGDICTGYQAAALVGGYIASTPTNQAITHKVVNGMVGLDEALTNAQIIKALTKGCIVLTTNRKGQVWVEQGINTLVSPGADQDDGWKKIRRARARFELMQRVDDTIEPIIGQLNNDTDGRATVIAAGTGIIKTMTAEHKLLDGTRMIQDANNPPKGDSAWFLFEVYDPDSMEKVYLTYRFRFAQSDANA